MEHIILRGVAFAIGTHIEEAIREAKTLAEKLGVYCVEIEFNGVVMEVGKYDDIEEKIKEYHKKLERGD